MTSDAISSLVVIDSVHPLAQVHRLAGQYQVHANAKAEIELVAEASQARSVVYAAVEPRFILVSPGRYNLTARPVSGDAISVELRRMNALDRAAFWLRKAAAVVRRGPTGVAQAIRALADRRSHNGIVGMALGKRGAATPPLRLERPVLEPAEVPASLMAVSIVIPTRDSVEMLKACILSLERIAGLAIEIIVVDNGATRPEARAYLDAIRSRPGISVLLLDIPFNFSRLCNAGARLARHPVLLFLNDDVEALDGVWLLRLLSFLACADTGVVGARLLYPSGDLQHAGIASNLVPGPGHPWRGQSRPEWERNPFVTTVGEVDAVTAACLGIRRDLFFNLGGFDEENFAVTINDVDLCLRVKALGLKVVYVPEATLVHKEGQSRRSDEHPGEAIRRRAELAAYVRRHRHAASVSCFYPSYLRRDTDQATPIV